MSKVVNINDNSTKDAEIQQLREGIRRLRWVVRDALLCNLPEELMHEAAQALSATKRFHGPREKID